MPTTSSSFCRLVLLCTIILLQQQQHYCNGYHSALMGTLSRAYPDYKPNAIIDIGANQGLWSQHIRRHYFPNAKLLLLEATHKHKESLRQLVEDFGNAEFRIAVLYSISNTTIPFYQHNNNNHHHGNSIYQQTNYANQAAVNNNNRLSSTVDHEVQQSFLRNEIIDIVKMDVQGAELDVLKGARHTLEQATFVQLEVSAVEHNAGAACGYDMDQFLRSLGYYLYDMDDFIRNGDVFKTKGIAKYDLLYIRPSSTRLPTYLQESQPRFCGQPSNNGAITTTTWQQSSSCIYNSSILNGTSWICGFAAGIAVTLLFQHVVRPHLMGKRRRTL